MVGCSISLVIIKMQIKTTRKDYLTPIRMAIIFLKKYNNIDKDMWNLEVLYTVGENTKWYRDGGKQYEIYSKS